MRYYAKILSHVITGCSDQPHNPKHHVIDNINEDDDDVNDCDDNVNEDYSDVNNGDDDVNENNGFVIGIFDVIRESLSVI